MVLVPVLLVGVERDAGSSKIIFQSLIKDPIVMLNPEFPYPHNQVEAEGRLILFQ
jgi:hypothetical protein